MRAIGKALALGAAAAFLLTGPALADRDPTPEERTQIEEHLRSIGFTSWEEIEWDDDTYWEIEDAIHSDGRQYDLQLAPDTLEVIKHEWRAPGASSGP